MGDLVQSLHRARDRAVVEEAQVLVAALCQEPVGRLDVHLAPEEMRELAIVVPWVVPLEAPGKALEEHVGNAGGDHLLRGCSVGVRNPIAGEEGSLPVDEDSTSRLVYVRGLAQEPRVGHHLGLAAAGHDHDLDAGPMAGLEHPRLARREVSLRSRETAIRGGRAGFRRGRCRRSEAPRSRTVHGRAKHPPPANVRSRMTRWRLADRVLEFPPPLAAGIVNVTDDSFFEGARSGTPERAIEDGIALVEAGFDLLDVGAVPARAGDPVDPDEEAARLVPAIEGLAQRVDVPVSADTFHAEVAARALDAGAVAINDISGGADPEMLELVGQRGCGYVLMHIEGPPRVDREPVRSRRPGRLPDRLVRRAARDRSRARGRTRTRSRSIPGFDFDLSAFATTARSSPASASFGGSGARSSSPCRGRTSSARFSPAPGRSAAPPRSASGRPRRRRRWRSRPARRSCGFTTDRALDALRVAAAIADPSAAAERRQARRSSGRLVPAGR